MVVFFFVANKNRPVVGFFRGQNGHCGQWSTLFFVGKRIGHWTCLHSWPTRTGKWPDFSWAKRTGEWSFFCFVAKKNRPMVGFLRAKKNWAKVCIISWQKNNQAKVGFFFLAKRTRHPIVSWRSHRKNWPHDHQGCFLSQRKEVASFTTPARRCSEMATGHPLRLSWDALLSIINLPK